MQMQPLDTSVDHDKRLPAKEGNNQVHVIPEQSQQQEERPEPIPFPSSNLTASITSEWHILLFAGTISLIPTAICLALFLSDVTTQLLLVPYIALQICTCLIAWKMRHSHRWNRLLSGFLVICVLSAFKSASFIPNIGNGEGQEEGEENPIYDKAVFYAITALWECSNAALIFGGEPLLNRNGIRDVGQIVLYSLAPCQVVFRSYCNGNNDGSSWQCFASSQTVWNSSSVHKMRVVWRSVHLFLAIVALWLFQAMLNKEGYLFRIASDNVIIETECLAIWSSLVVLIFNFPSHIWHTTLILTSFTPWLKGKQANLNVVNETLVVLPYGLIYTCTSTREFWSKWSRPGTQFIRHLFYHTLGGRKYWFFSIPFMFFLNGTSHYDLSYSINGDRAEVGWNVVFGVLSLAAMLEVGCDGLMDQYCTRIEGDSEYRAQSHHEVGGYAMNLNEGADSYANLDNQTTQPVSISADASNVNLPLWYRIARGMVAHVSLRVALYVLWHKCLHLSILTIVDGDSS